MLFYKKHLFSVYFRRPQRFLFFLDQSTMGKAKEQQFKTGL
jgi:hypothetical protein